ncbi:MAG: hypothetical protein HZC01_02150 [Candidatus Kerfeldbacteria bacterium]|nr:hypothetical protein [Candidatus Kerfeldbacteria bacterium]
MARQGTLVPSVQVGNLQQLGQRLRFARSMVPTTMNGKPTICLRYRGLLLAVFGDKQPISQVSRPKVSARIHVKSGTPWSAAEKRKLRRQYATTPMAKLCISLRRTRDSIYHQAQLLGLTKKTIHRNGRVELPWTKQADRRLRRLYPRHTGREIAALMQRPLGSVAARIGRLGLVK